MHRDVEIRNVAEADHREWLAALATGFLRAEPVTDQDAEVAPVMMGLDPARTLGAYDGGRCVGTFRSIPRELTVPGGAVLPASGVTSATVTATHRRRGLLSRMMDRELAACRERGEPIAILIAAEYPIYGRHGFGPATWTTEWKVEVPRTQMHRAPSGASASSPDGGRIELADPAEVRAIGPGLHERVRRLTPGAIDRPDHWWRMVTGDLRMPMRPYEDFLTAVHRDATGRVDGMLSYVVDQAWQAKMPQNTLTVLRHEATTPQAAEALWRYALSMDWVTWITSGYRAPDDVLPLLLGDPRAARIVTHADFMWLRVLDVVTTLEARTYATTGSLVLRLHDAAGHADGTFRLDASPESGGTRVAATTAAADLAMDIAELATLYLGDESAVRLAALGRVEELTPGAAARADLLMRTPRRPWCPDMF